ncbi:MAG TPA: hypothetical protein VFJ90_00100, partial [Candidatus Didemnitutus sp.]|nr:hypothetical protein [Candidatus Didemnitutus sp.]
MNLPTLIDVAIGLVLVFFLLATIGSLLAEMWAAHQKIRHSLLRKTVEKLLDRDSARKFWAHSLIEPLVGTARIKPRQIVPPASSVPAPTAPTGAPVSAAAATPAAAPSPPKTVASKMTRKKSEGHVLLAPFRGLKRLVKKITEFLRPREAEAPGYLDANLFAAVVLDIASGQGAAGRVPNTLGAWRRVIIDQVPDKPGENNDLQDRLLTLLRQVPSDTADVAATLKTAVAKWYDQAMERASSVYRRQTQRSLLVIGAILALALNVDAVRIVQVLYLNPNLREQIAQQGIQTYTAHVDENGKQKAAPADQSNREQLKGYAGDLRNMVKAGFPLGWMPEWQANFIHLPESTQPEAPPSTPPESAATDQGLLESVAGFFSAAGHAIAGAWHTFTSPGWLALFAKVCGLAASAFAVCLGAPFWFDLLGRLVKMRSSAGADAEKKKDDPSATTSTPSPGGPGPAGAAPAPIAPPPPPAPLPSALDALALPGTAFDVARASWLAEFADRAYETNRSTLTHWLDENGFKLVKSFDAQGTQGYLATSANSAVLAFRGTEKKLEDWVSDSRFELVDGKAVAVDGQVHQGFSDALLLISAAVD